MRAWGAPPDFVGKVKDDDAGREFAHDIRKAGVAFDTPAAADGAATARCLIFVTPDGQRTMNTFLGACQALAPTDIDEATVARAKVLYMEGYLWDPPGAKEAFLKAAKISRANGRKVAITLSDAFCVDRYRGEFLSLIRDRVVDIVFANESELHALYQTGDFETALTALRAEDGLLGVVTRSEKGCVVANGASALAAPACSVDAVVDTTGAGDLFAAGFLAGYTQDLPHERSADARRARGGGDHLSCRRAAAEGFAAARPRHWRAGISSGFLDLRRSIGDLNKLEERKMRLVSKDGCWPPSPPSRASRSPLKRARKRK